MSKSDHNRVVFDIIHNRRSIRKFLEKDITDETLNTLLEAGIRAPFAAQLCTIIYTRDLEKMRNAGIGVYPTAPIHLIFFIDLRRLEKIMKKRGHEYGYDDMMAVWLGMQDVSLVIENIIITGEALGLGSVLYGVVPVRADTISKVFDVPKRVFPVVGLSIGYPDPKEDTQIRPRFPIKHTAFEDCYHDHSDSDIQECMNEMDEGYLAQGYYIKERIKVPLDDKADEIDFDRYSWSEHISRKFRHTRWKGEPFLEILRRHGFNV